jgi:beta-catenin-like protein 1
MHIVPCLRDMLTPYTCGRFVGAMGLKTLFPGLLKPGSIMAKKAKDAKSSGSTREDEEHVVSIIASLLLRLSGDSHARAVNKFVENDFEKLDKLLELHEKYFSLCSQQDEEEEEEEEVEEEEEEEDGKSEEEKAKAKAERLEAMRYARRLDKGLFTLQQVIEGKRK